jgi:hypothetical protein
MVTISEHSSATHPVVLETWLVVLSRLSSSNEAFNNTLTNEAYQINEASYSD